jgi:CRP/FNR family transcriptional regulator, cyclic AMP receptor protein
MAGRSSTDRTERVRAIPLFSGVPETTLRRIAEAMTQVEVPAGQVLIQQGQPGAGILIVEEGSVVVERPGREPIELGPGEFLGELALLTTEGVHTARVRTTTTSVLLAMGRQEFLDLLQEEPRIAVAMLPTMAERLAQLYGE